MKKRFFMRGFGVGLIITVALYSAIIIPRKYKLSDDEIIARAKKLGLTEEADVKLPDMSPAPDETGEGENTENTQTEDAEVSKPPKPSEPEKPDTPSEAPTPSDVPTPSKAPTPTSAPTPTKAPTPTSAPTPTKAPTPTSAPTPTKAPTPTSAPTPDEDPIPTAAAGADGENKKVTVTVSKGMGSAEFARAAQKAGLVENAEEFDKYLMKNGYASKIMIGSYEIFVGATYKEIAEIITAR